MTDLVELGEQIQGAAYMLGQICGIEHAAKYLRTTSGTLFARGDDEEAKIYRKIAVVLEEMAKTRTITYNSEYRQQVDEGFEKLDEIQKRLASFFLDGVIDSTDEAA